MKKFNRNMLAHLNAANKKSTQTEEKKSFNPMLNSSLNSKKLESLGWKPVFTKEEGFEHSVKICKEIL